MLTCTFIETKDKNRPPDFVFRKDKIIIEKVFQSSLILNATILYFQIIFWNPDLEIRNIFGKLNCTITIGIIKSAKYILKLL